MINIYDPMNRLLLQINLLVGMRTIVVIFLAFVGPLAAQPALLSTPITIRGTVVEGGINSPIANAAVTLDRPDLATRAGRENERTTSAADGSFQFKVQTTGSFTVSASLKGYGGISGRIGLASDVQRVFIMPQTKSPVEVRLILARAATITGQIVDFEKSTPLPGIPVRLVLASYIIGRLIQISSGPVETNENGQFEISAPSVGRYALHAPERHPFTAHITPEPPQNDAPPEYGYESPYWPGVEDIESARVFQLDSGSRINAGTLALRLMPHYLARVAVRGADCKVEAPLTARLSRELRDRRHQTLETKQIVCGQDFGLRALRTGRYQLEIFTRQEAVESRKRAKIVFDVTDHHQNLDVVLTPGTNLTGAFLAPEGFRDFDKLSLNIFAVDAVPLDPLGHIEVDAKGSFTIPNLPIGEMMYVQTGALPPGFYVRRVRYSNREINENTLFPFVWNGGSLTVEIDNQPATVSGTVHGSDGNPASSARVVLGRLPLNRVDMGSSLISAFVDETGSFRITGLQDAEYRVFAYTSNNAEMLNEPGRVEQILTNAKRVSLKRGETQALELNLTDISR